MTKYKINLIEAKDEISLYCPFGRSPELDEYNFEFELNFLIECLNKEIKNIYCEKYDNTSIIVKSEINSIHELQEKIKPVFIKMMCNINYDNKNPMTIIKE